MVRVRSWPRTELDLLLVQHNNPRHILVGECKYAWEYKGAYFGEGRGFVERVAKAIRDSPKIRTALDLPREMPVVAVLFVSHSGRDLTVRRPSLMVTMTHVLSGQFRESVESWLSLQEGST